MIKIERLEMVRTPAGDIASGRFFFVFRLPALKDWVVLGSARVFCSNLFSQVVIVFALTLLLDRHETQPRRNRNLSVPALQG